MKLVFCWGLLQLFHSCSDTSVASSASVLSSLSLSKLLLLSIYLSRLRALSGGGGGSGGSSNAVVSPPLSPALPKYKLAEYRYGREEMLALYIKDNKVSITSSRSVKAFSRQCLHINNAAAKIRFTLSFIQSLLISKAIDCLFLSSRSL